MDREAARIRPYRGADLDALYRICLLTANNGQDATTVYQDPMLPGHIFAAPYALFEPSLAFVAEDAAGVGGYIVGALDNRAFLERLERDWWPKLRRRYPEPPPDVPEPRWTRDQRAAYLIHHPWGTPDDLAASYPSQLHINLLPRLQGRGYGSQLMHTLTEALRRRASQGVHLYVAAGNQRAARFYRHLGLAELAASDDAYLFAMELSGYASQHCPGDADR